MEQTYSVYEKISSRDLIGRKTGWIGLVGNLLLVLIKLIAGEFQGVLNILRHFLCEGEIRRAVNVVFMGFPYIVENGIPCFMRYMAEKIFFL